MIVADVNVVAYCLIEGRKPKPRAGSEVWTPTGGSPTFGATNS